MWPTFYMEITKQYPPRCELDELTAIATSICDPLDGVNDVLISDPEGCRAVFDPFDYIEALFKCLKDPTETVRFTAVADAAYKGPVFSNGKPLRYGFEIGADLGSIVPTDCARTGCVATGHAMIELWYHSFDVTDTPLDISNLTHRDFDNTYQMVKRTHAPFLTTNQCDLSAFRDAGGQMITFDGLLGFIGTKL